MNDMPATPPVKDPSCCPLCGDDNRCAMELERATGQPQTPCWCVAEAFPSELLARLPDAERRQACVCSRCLADFASSSASNP